MKSTKNSLDKFYKQLSKVGKYEPKYALTNPKKVYRLAAINSDAEPFYNYIRSILKVTSEFEETIRSKFDSDPVAKGGDSIAKRVGSDTLKELEYERKNYKNGRVVKNKYCSKLLEYLYKFRNIC